MSQPVEFRECLVGCFCAPTGSPFQVGPMPPLHLAVIFFEFLAARVLNLLFQVANLAVERAHAYSLFSYGHRTRAKIWQRRWVHTSR